MTNKLTKAETIAFLQTEAAALAAGKPTTHLTEKEINTLLKVANKMSPDKFYCQEQFNAVINICHEPLAELKGTKFHNEMFDKYLDKNGVYLMCKHSTSRVCANEVTQFQYSELSDKGDCMPIGAVQASTSDTLKYEL